MKILVIEDSYSMAQALCEVLQRQGHQTTWLFGVQSLEPFVGRLQDGSTVDIDPTAFDLVFEDGELDGSPFQGVPIVQHLTSCGVKAAALSTMPALNKEMVSCGALVGACKPIMLAALHAGLVTVEGIIEDKQGTTARLEELAKTQPKDPKYAQAWNEIEARLKELMKIEYGI